MEKREEIKDGIKQRIIELMSEQITKEESFADLKSEVIEEFFHKKETKTPVVNESPKPLTDTFSFVAAKAEDSLQKIKERQAEYYKKIVDVKLGKNTNENIQRLIKQLQDTDSTSYADILQKLDGRDIPDYNEFIIDPRLKSDFTETKKEELRVLSLDTLEKIMSNPFSKTLEAKVSYFSNEDNYRKEYSAYDSEQNFRFECSYTYNKETNQKYIDKFSVDSKGFLLTGAELGIPFAIEAMYIMDQAEQKRQDAIDIVEGKTKRKPSPRRKRTTNKK